MTSYTTWPGSDAARDIGCTCPTMDNARGDVELARARGGWWMTGQCPVHCTGGSAPLPALPDGDDLA